MQTLERETSGDLSKAPIQASIVQHIPIAAAIFFMLLNLNGIMAPVVRLCIFGYCVLEKQRIEDEHMKRAIVATK